MKQIEVNGTVYEFPETMSDDDIKGVLRKKFPPQQSAPSTPQQTIGDQYDAALSKATEAPRHAFWDALFGPSQMLAGLADLGNEGAKKLGLPWTSNSSMSDSVSALRNRLAGRPGISPGPYTGLVQGLSTAPMGPGIFKSALQGAGLGSGLAEKGQDRLVEGGKGAGTAVAASTVARMFGGAKPTSSANQSIMDTAKREGVDVRYGTQTGSPMMKEIEARSERSVLLGGLGSTNLATKQREAIDDQFARALWRRVGMKETTEFTPENFKKASEVIGKDFELPFKLGPIPLTKADKTPLPEFTFALKNAEKVAADIAEPKYLNAATKLVKNKLELGKLSKSERNFVMEELRGLRTSAKNDNQNNVAKAIDSIIDSFDVAAIRNIPNQMGKEKYLDASRKWANLKVIEDAFVKSADSARGNIDPAKLKSAIERSMPGGYTYGRADMTDLANLGLAQKGKSALPEGAKLLTLDPFIYTAFNNPMSIGLRKNNPIDSETLAALLKAGGVQLNTE